MHAVEIAAPKAPPAMRTPKPWTSNPSLSLAITGSIDSTDQPKNSATNTANINERTAEFAATYLAP